ncbi:MAG: hypothetical protein U0M23_05020 [Acutalibacteraceae bacterium]|nr:hypothetical protein [Acutalibacteraceae bacterium]HIR02703.1 hypothetical protein [Candidatus Scatovicinus merdipullorum]
MKKLKENSVLFSFGGLTYGIIEILWRRYTHWSMIITGGVCFLLLFRIFNKAQRLTLLKKCLIGSAVITSIEFVVGVVVNIILKMDVWDYSSMPFNLWGQVCPLYSLLWGILTIPISYLCGKMKKVVKKI